MIGDQLFTDIVAGNRLGLYTILVNPLGSHEFIGTKVISRNLERLVLRGPHARVK
jgi:predicted HAD superfamily phosphohydrolase YqeG